MRDHLGETNSRTIREASADALAGRIGVGLVTMGSAASALVIGSWGVAVALVAGLGLFILTQMREQVVLAGGDVVIVRLFWSRAFCRGEIESIRWSKGWRPRLQLTQASGSSARWGIVRFMDRRFGVLLPFGGDVATEHLAVQARLPIVRDSP